MKKHLIFIAILLSGSLTGHAGSPLTGIKSIPVDIASIKLAIDSINTWGIGPGGVTFNVAAGYTETFAARTNGLIVDSTSNSTRPIVFRKNGEGTNPLITSAAGTGTTDYIICIAGTDYITFDGIDLQDASSNTTTNTQAEWGYALLRTWGQNGAQHVTIRNCGITLNRTNTATIGIYSNRSSYKAPGTSLLYAASTFAGTNSYNSFQGNTINNCYIGIRLYGLANIAPYDKYDINTDVGSVTGNTITNFGYQTGTALAMQGIHIANNNNFTVANNLVTNTTIANQTQTCHGIFLEQTASASVDFYNNTVSNINYGGTGQFFGIQEGMSSTATGSNVVNFHHNTVTGCLYTGTSSTTTTYINFSHACHTLNFYNNSVTNNTFGNASLTTTGNTTLTYMAASGFPTAPFGTVNFNDNIVSGNIRQQASTVTGGSTVYMSCSMQSTKTYIYNNLVDNNTTNTPSSVTGITSTTSNSCQVKNIFKNTVTNLTGSKGTMTGITFFGGVTDSIYRNKVQNLSTSYAPASQFSPAVQGIYTGSMTAAGNMYVYENFIGDLKATADNYATAIIGLWLYATPCNYLGCFNNTIYLNASSTGANFGTTGISMGGPTETAQSVDFRNNIVVNTSTPNGTGLTTAILNTSTNTSLSNLSGSCNNNDYYAGVPAANRLIYYDGIKGDQTILEYQARVYPKERLSITENPPFISTVAGSMNLHINNTVATQCESSGTIISSPISVKKDYDNNDVYPNPGYPDNPSYPAMAPDLGADEFGGIPLDLTAPLITYTALGNTPYTSNRTLTATITDVTGVPTSGTGTPRVYWKRFYNGSWNNATATYAGNHQYNFFFGSGTSVGDTVYYYVAAQDLQTPANVITFPFNNVGGLTSNPPAASIPPTNADKYIVLPSICGTKTVGVSGDYPTLTAAINDLNNKVISCPVTFLLQDAMYSINENFPITFNPNGGSSAENTVTIRPQAGNSATITGASNEIFKLNGFDYLIIDGSNSGGSDQHLHLENTLDATGANVIGFYNNGGLNPSTNVTIKNVKISGTYTTVSKTCGIYFDGTAGGYDNCTISNDSINTLYTGIQYKGSASAISHNLQVLNNVIGASDAAKAITFRGIVLSYADNTLIEGNEIMGQIDGDTVAKQAGIFLSALSTNTKIRKNRIHDFYHPVDPDVPGAAMGATGIRFEAESNTVTEISNNEIYRIKSPGQAPGPSPGNSYGIYIYSGGNIKIHHNSIYMSGDVLSPTTLHDASSACIGIYNPGTITNNVEILNNVLKNSMGPSQGNPCGMTGKTYAIFTMATDASNFSALDYNDYYVDGCTPRIGGLNSNNYATLSAWQTATGMDTHSNNIDPVFSSVTHLVPTAAGMDHAGTYLSSVPTDIDGANRTNPPDVGAYEFSPRPVIATDSTHALTSGTVTLYGSGDALGGSVDVFFDYGTTTAYGNSVAAAPNTLTGSGNTAFSLPVAGLTPATTYHFRARGIDVASGLVIYGSDREFITPEDLKTFNLTLFEEGLYAGAGTMNQAQDENGPHFGAGIADQVTIELHDAVNYSVIHHTFLNADLHTNGSVSLQVPGTYSGSYYITVLHRNGIATVSASPVSFAIGPVNYNFSNSPAKAYGDNMLAVDDNLFAMYSGDCNQDGYVDSGDFSAVDNDVTNFVTGYVSTDVNGDSFVDTGDFTIIDNNNASFIYAVTP